MFSAEHRSASVSSRRLARLNRDHRRDRLRIGQLDTRGAAQRHIPDEALLAQFGERAEYVGDRVLRDAGKRPESQVDDVERLEAEFLMTTVMALATAWSPAFPFGTALHPDAAVDRVGLRDQVAQAIARLLG